MLSQLHWNIWAMTIFAPVGDRPERSLELKGEERTWGTVHRRMKALRTIKDPICKTQRRGEKKNLSECSIYTRLHQRSAIYCRRILCPRCLHGRQIIGQMSQIPTEERNQGRLISKWQFWWLTVSHRSPVTTLTTYQVTRDIVVRNASCIVGRRHCHKKFLENPLTGNGWPCHAS